MPVTLLHNKKQPDGSYVKVATEYVTVVERLQMLRDDESAGSFSIETGIAARDGGSVTVWAKVMTQKGTFMGLACSRFDALGIEGQAPTEVAETSAIGRALGFAGYGAVESIASAEEVIVAQARESKPAASPPPGVTALQCVHGNRQWREGMSKQGNAYRGWFCIKGAGGCEPVWVKDKVAASEDAEAALPFE